MLSILQHIDKPTRRRGNGQPSQIDLVFTDEVMQVSDIVHHAPLGKSDHSVITFQFHCYLNYSKPKERFVYAKVNYDGMRNHFLESCWEDDYSQTGKNKNVEELWTSLRSKLIDVRNQFVPKQTITGISTWKEMSSFPINKHIQDAIRIKMIAHRHLMCAKNRVNAEATRLKYTKARNKAKTMMRQAKRRYEKERGQELHQ